MFIVKSIMIICIRDNPTLFSDGNISVSTNYLSNFCFVVLGWFYCKKLCKQII